MNKQLCYCNNCKGINVSKKTFRRHLLKENQLNFHIKPKQKITKKHDEYIDIYLNNPYQMNSMSYQVIMILLQLLHIIQKQKEIDQFLRYLFCKKIIYLI